MTDTSMITRSSKPRTRSRCLSNGRVSPRKSERAQRVRLTDSRFSRQWLTDTDPYSLSVHRIMDSPDQEWRSFRAILPLHGFQGRDQCQPGAKGIRGHRRRRRPNGVQPVSHVLVPFVGREPVLMPLVRYSFYMKYSPAEDGSFDGQRGYGYLSFEKWIDAV